MIGPRHAPPGAYVDDPAEKLDRPASEQPSVFALASHGMTRIKEWAARGRAKQRALRHDLVTLSLCPEMLPCKHPSAAWCAREHGVSRQWASRLHNRANAIQSRRGRVRRGTRDRSPARSQAHSPIIGRGAEGTATDSLTTLFIHNALGIPRPA
jgi:hypothetical protein